MARAGAAMWLLRIPVITSRRSLVISGISGRAGRCRRMKHSTRPDRPGQGLFSNTLLDRLMDQARTPYLEALVRYASERNVPFHTPGHIQGRGAHQALLRTFGPRTLELDLCTGLDHLDGAPDSALA